MDLDTMRTAVRERCGVTATDQLAATAQLTNLVNAALHALEAERVNGWPWLHSEVDLTLTASVDEYTFDDITGALALGRLAKVKYAVLGSSGSTTRWPLTRMSREEQRSRWLDDTEGRPESWSLIGETVRLRPVPDQAYDVSWGIVLNEPDLSGDTDEPVLPPRFRNAVVEKACAMLFRRMHNTAEAQVAEAEYRDWLRRMERNARLYAGAGRVHGAAAISDWT